MTSLSRVRLSQQSKEKRKKEKEKKELTFCGDLDVGTGDCDLMFLAEEPGRWERERGVK